MSTSKIVMRVVSISFTILLVVLIILGFSKIGAYAYDFGYRIFTEEAIDEAPGKDVIVNVEAGMSAADIGALLEDKGLVRNRLLFQVQLMTSAHADEIRPGIYTLNTSMTATDMIQIMSVVEEDTEEE